MEYSEKDNLKLAKDAAKLFGWLTHTDWHEWLGESWILVESANKHNMKWVISHLFYRERMEQLGANQIKCKLFSDLSTSNPYILDVLLSDMDEKKLDKVNYLNSILDGINLENKKILELRFRGLNSQEIGEQLNINANVVRKRLQRTLEFLRDNFK